MSVLFWCVMSSYSGEPPAPNIQVSGFIFTISFILENRGNKSTKRQTSQAKSRMNTWKSKENMKENEAKVIQQQKTQRTNMHMASEGK